MFRFVLVFLFLVSPVAALAGTTLYECTIKPKGNTAWIPEVLQIEHDPETGEAFVLDPIIYHFNEKRPVLAEIAANNEKRLTFSWTVKGASSATNQYVTNFRFRASYLKKSGKMTVTSSPDGYIDNFRGSGRCKVSAQ